MKRLKVTNCSGHYWYQHYIGKIFDIIEEFGESYCIGVIDEIDDMFRVVMKKDCKVICEKCDGTGKYEGDLIMTCPFCDGTGYEINKFIMSNDLKESKINIVSQKNNMKSKLTETEFKNLYNTCLIWEHNDDDVYIHNYDVSLKIAIENGFVEKESLSLKEEYEDQYKKIKKLWPNCFEVDKLYKLGLKIIEGEN